MTGSFRHTGTQIAAPMPGEIGPYLTALPKYLKRRRELLEANRVYELLPAWETKMVEAADNPGKWMVHCHMLEHQAAGMAAWFEVA